MDYYQVPTLILLWLLVAVFAALNIQRRNWRRRLWLAGWLLTATQMLLECLGAHGPWATAGITCCGTLGMLMFLGSLAVPFVGQRRIAWVAIFAVPTLAYVIMATVENPAGPLVYAAEVSATVACAVVAVAWSTRPVYTPAWVTVGWSSAISIICLYFALRNDPGRVMQVAEAGIGIWTALLIGAVYRRPTPGVIFTAAGFVVWHAASVLVTIFAVSSSYLLLVGRSSNLVRVVAAVGMIALVLEEETRENAEAQRRDRQARREMERYAALYFPVGPHEDFIPLYRAVVEAASEASAFSLVGVLVRQVQGRMRLAALAGANDMQAAALERLAAELTEPELMSAWEEAQVRRGHRFEVGDLDLCRWFSQMDAAEFSADDPVRGIGISTRAGDLQGVILLGERKNPAERFMPEDLMPLHLLASRLAAARESSAMQRRVAQSERLAGIGRLAGGVAHELNNPLTVVMGYAELMEEIPVSEKMHEYAGVIRREAHRMRQVIEGLTRFWRPSPSPVAAMDLERILRRLEEVLRPECERQGVRLEVSAETGLPAARANGERLEQVLKQLVSNAAQAAASDGEEARVRMEAGHGEEHLRIVVSNSGAGFQEPERLFDPFATLKPRDEGAGLAMSLCYSMIRELGGDMSAYNLQPRGAAVIVELPVAMPDEPGSFRSEARGA
ncbi:sensor histidine kinase [Silvibacterium sp.]|uniref:sensor histidine kinase n=1 Tax=Silvibacterium sp. TaxID=1964179 RepID=UPI0039E36AA0